MVLKTLIPVDHGVLFVAGDENGEFATAGDSVNPVHATSTALTIATLHEQEGSVGIVVTDNSEHKDFEALKLIGTYSIASPDNVLRIYNTSLADVMEWPVSSSKTTLEVWLDDFTQAAIVGLLMKTSRDSTKRYP